MTTSLFDHQRDPLDAPGATSTLGGREEEPWRLDEPDFYDVGDEDEDDDESWSRGDWSSL